MKAPVAHHFNNILQQQATVRLGMWLFLITEVLFFGGAFCAYTVYRVWFPREFEAGSAALNVGIASVNTFLLLTSSLTITLAIRSAYQASQTGLKVWLMATIILGSLFLGLKGREYYLDYEEGLIPTGANVWVQEQQPNGTYEMVEKPLFAVNVEKVPLSLFPEMVRMLPAPPDPERVPPKYKPLTQTVLVAEARTAISFPIKLNAVTPETPAKRTSSRSEYEGAPAAEYDPFIVLLLMVME